MSNSATDVIDVGDISPLAWRLLRTAAGYEQRAVEREIDEVMQAHVSMLETGNRGLSNPRRHALLELYTEELSENQVRAIADNF